MFEVAIGLAIVLGLIAGGRLENLFRIQLRWAWLLFVAVLLRFGTEAAIRYDVGAAETLRLPLYGLAFGLLAGVLWVNRAQPGLLVAAAGITANGIAIVANGGWMPVWGPALQLVGMTSSDLVLSFHRLLPEQLGLEFLLRGGPFGDLIPIPLPLITNVASIGDAFVAAGLAWFLFASFVSQHPTEPFTPEPVPAPAPSPATMRQAPTTFARTPAIALTPAAARRAGLPLHLAPRAGVRDAAVLRRPVLMGGTPTGLALPQVSAAVAGAAAIPAVTVRPPWTARLGAHAYVRLALDARFSAMWLGQLISLLGDRLNQVALSVLVYSITGSPAEMGLMFLAATLPNLLFGPLAGTLVDRWDQKHVMVMSDLLRAGLVLLIPLAADRDVHLVYPVVFAVTTVSIFFRPARAAVLPRIVRSEDLNAANGATWSAENFADIGGYAFAGVFVAFLGSALTIAFWFDAASYLISAALLASITIPPVARTVLPVVGGAVRRFLDELTTGWRFLTRDAPLFQNTLMSAVGQLSVGATIALMVVYARGLDGSLIPYPQSYAALDVAIGVGNLAGGVAIGALANRWRKGHLVIAGYLVMGVATMALGSTGNEVLAFSCMLVIGVSNMVFLIPTQTLFAERTPADLMGRVIGTRFSIVFGSLTGAMAVSGIMAESMGAGAVFVVFGAITAIAGVIGILLPAIRNV